MGEGNKKRRKEEETKNDRFLPSPPFFLTLLSFPGLSRTKPPTASSRSILRSDFTTAAPPTPLLRLPPPAATPDLPPSHERPRPLCLPPHLHDAPTSSQLASASPAFPTTTSQLASSLAQATTRSATPTSTSRPDRASTPSSSHTTSPFQLPMTTAPSACLPISATPHTRPSAPPTRSPANARPSPAHTAAPLASRRPTKRPSPPRTPPGRTFLAPTSNHSPCSTHASSSPFPGVPFLLRHFLHPKVRLFTGQVPPDHPEPTAHPPRQPWPRPRSGEQGPSCPPLEPDWSRLFPECERPSFPPSDGHTFPALQPPSHRVPASPSILV